MNKPMDKSWINLEYRLDESYVKGANEFLKFAMANKLPGSEIYCPCTKCQNIKLVQEKVAYEHIIVNGFLRNYKNWIYHGEPLCTDGRDNDAARRPNLESSICDDMVGMIHDAFGIPNMDDVVDDEPSQTMEGPDIETEAYFKLLKDAECELYPEDVETKSNRPIRNYDGNNKSGRGLGGGKQFLLDDITWVQAHRYVLMNFNAIASFREKHVTLLRSERPRAGEHQICRIHNETFHIWFMDHVKQLRQTSNAQISPEVEILSAGPDQWGRRYTGYVINGFRFRTKERESKRKTQNSGVLLNASTTSFASARDRNPVEGDVSFYGVLTDIIELRYTNDLKFVLFKCDWIDNNAGRKIDEFGFTLVNFKHLLYKENRLGDEPFILASQAQQVWYVQDSLEKDWHIVVIMTPRDVFDVLAKEHMIEPQVEPYNGQHLDDNIFTNDEDSAWVMRAVDGATIDVNIVEDDDVDTESDDDVDTESDDD
ncbi:hypothetical protein F0562_030754 [Nyssa sinensis]|uniref:Transposase-associated domain-containing protein n=1 Tax=Nyssa sinensis TaxID=561372 RepID=A0A5J5AZ85_9ASTE|nr:hypothetical protein F0562_030754 [Nyssa sinensis]